MLQRSYSPGELAAVPLVRIAELRDSRGAWIVTALAVAALALALVLGRGESEKVIAERTAETYVADWLRALPREPTFTSVDCPGPQPIRQEATFTCTAVDDRGGEVQWKVRQVDPYGAIRVETGSGR
jgi:hypothetical protein